MRTKQETALLSSVTTDIISKSLWLNYRPQLETAAECNKQINQE